MNAHIDHVSATVIEDSRAKETIAVTVCAGEAIGTFAVPSGASVGAREAHTLPAANAVTVVEEVIAPALSGMDVTDQHGIDHRLHELDESERFEAIGGNSAIGVSIAALKAAAVARGITCADAVALHFTHAPQAATPRLFVNLINGGAHATRGSDIQEHQVIPDALDVRTALRMVSAIETELASELEDVYGIETLSRGDEGGFEIASHTTEAPFAHLMAAIERAGMHGQISLGADMAASSFFHDGEYVLNGTRYTTKELYAEYLLLHEQFPLLHFVEDPFFEDNLDAFTAYCKAAGDVCVIGDDVTTTRERALASAIAARAVHGVIIKPNQIGTVTDTLHTMEAAYEHGVRCIVSHRSGETYDDFIADLVVGTGAYGIKAGAPHAPERRVKYDRLITLLS